MSDDLDIMKIDFDWVENQTKPQMLKKAMKILELDGNAYPDLHRTIKEKLIKIDPKYKALQQANMPLDPETEKKIDNDMNNWEKEIQQQKKISIFEDEQSKEKVKKLAEDQKNKGNEALRANDLQEALQYYTKSIEYDPFLAATYCNRALIHLKMKNFGKAVEDANKAIQLNPEYLKAYHRRGKANYELKKYLEAAQDFQFILKKDPENKEVQKDNKEARYKLTKEQLEQLDKSGSSFKNITIVEEEEEEETMNQYKDNQSTLNTTQQTIEKDSQLSKEGFDRLQKLNDKLIQEKQQALDLIKKGLYLEAKKILLEHITKYNQLISEFPLDNNQLQQSVHQKICQYKNNVALCYMRLEEMKHVIQITTEILEDKVLKLEYSQENIDLIVKAYLRRALAYENLEQFELARRDFKRVKLYDPNNLQSSQGLYRISKFLPRDEHDYDKEKIEHSPIQSPKIQNYVISPVNDQCQQTFPDQQSEQQTFPDQQSEQQTFPDQQSEKKVEISLLNLELLKQSKEEGNKFFQNSDFTKAEASFSSSIEQIQQNLENQEPHIKNQATELLIQLLTNRSLLYFNKKQYQSSQKDAEMALKYNDENIKALYRCAMAIFTQANLQLDLVQLKQENEISENEKQMLQALNESSQKSKNLFQKILLKEKCNKQVQEKFDQNVRQLSTIKNLFQKFNITTVENKETQQEVLKENKIEQKKEIKSKDKNKEATQAVTNATFLNEVTAKAVNEVTQELIEKQEIPNTPVAFEKHLTTFRKKQDQLFNYLKVFYIGKKHQFIYRIYQEKPFKNYIAKEISRLIYIQ